MRPPPTLNPKNLSRTLGARVPVKALRDLKNRALFGRRAPRSDECIFVDPHHVRLNYVPGKLSDAPRLRRYHSGLVLDGDWDLSVEPRRNAIKERAISSHFRDGVPWEETGIFDYLMADIARKGSADGMHTLAEIRERYQRLDRLYERIRRDGRLKPREELPEYFRREHGGIYIHIGRDGTPLKAGGGTHRLEIARLLNLPTVPAQLGAIHPQALENGILERLRHNGRAKDGATGTDGPPPTR